MPKDVLRGVFEVIVAFVPFVLCVVVNMVGRKIVVLMIGVVFIVVISFFVHLTILITCCDLAPETLRPVLISFQPHENHPFAHISHIM